MEAEVRNDADQVPEAVMGEGALEGILFKPMAEDILGPSKEVGAKDTPAPQEEVVDVAREKGSLEGDLNSYAPVFPANNFLQFPTFFPHLGTVALV
ncbi:UNVERIFIED_CONTAM: hypothetical protein Sangu_0675900 [Sesamum angustifolium]|uniref:Uncharacterized protein n=1 Tax=Sesamum angustifolium TaxID=2727405 RepID=A0AAW2PQ25_9LAMI